MECSLVRAVLLGMFTVKEPDESLGWSLASLGEDVW